MKEIKQYKPLNITLTVIFIAALIVLMLTFSIGLPIYCRFFYYIQIKTLGMEKATGWDYNTIKTAYDEVLNYLTLPNRPFGTGELKFSEDGAAHFADCKVLFDLNFYALLISTVITTALTVLHKLKVVTIVKIKGHRAFLLSAIIAVALPVIIGVLCAIDFDKAFEVFHSIFFPGKTNWVFDPRYDQIIEVMPEEFFMNCAIIIGVSLVAFSAALITVDLLLARKDKKKGQ